MSFCRGRQRNVPRFKRHVIAIVLLIKPFVLRCSRHRGRRGLLKLPICLAKEGNSLRGCYHGEVSQGIYFACTPWGFRFTCVPRDQENLYTEKMQTLQQTLVEERDKILQNANQQKSMLEESLHSTKSEEQRLRTKLAEAEEVGLLVFCFFLGRIKTTSTTNHFILPDLQEKKKYKIQKQLLSKAKKLLWTVRKLNKLSRKKNIVCFALVAIYMIKEKNHAQWRKTR